MRFWLDRQNSTVAAPATNPGIVHPASERSAARMCFTARIYCPCAARAECGAADRRAFCGESRPRAVNRANGARPRCTFVVHDTPTHARAHVAPLGAAPDAASRAGRLPFPAGHDRGGMGQPHGRCDSDPDAGRARARPRAPIRTDDHVVRRARGDRHAGAPLQQQRKSQPVQRRVALHMVLDRARRERAVLAHAVGVGAAPPQGECRQHVGRRRITIP